MAGVKQLIRKKIFEVKKETRDFSLSQKLRWRKVYDLLIEIDAGSRTKFHVHNKTFVDLMTGELVMEDGLPAPGRDVLVIADNINRIDAQSIISRLKTRLKHVHWKGALPKTSKK